jgi:hypothetical protein
VKLDARLRRLEKSAPPPCPACRDRQGRAVLVTYHEGVAEGEVPQPCPRCGRVPEDVIELDIVVVTSPGERPAGGQEGGEESQ